MRYKAPGTSEKFKRSLVWPRQASAADPFEIISLYVQKIEIEFKVKTKWTAVKILRKTV